MIYILDEKPEITVQYLDDHSLYRMIKSIAHTLCNMQWSIIFDKLIPEDIDIINLSISKLLLKYERPPLRPLKKYRKWSQWARESLSHYLYLVWLGLACCMEYDYRFCDEKKDYVYPNSLHKMYGAILWAHDNEPDLPEGEMTHLPLVMPEKYIKYWNCNIDNPTHEPAVIESYRNYYRAKLSKLSKRKIKRKIAINNEIAEFGILEGYITTTWTRRSKPEWL